MEGGKAAGEGTKGVETAEEEVAVREEGKEVEAAVVEGTGKGGSDWEGAREEQR